MKKHTTLLATLALAASCSLASASITDASWNTANSGQLNCSYLYPFANNTLDMDATQYVPGAIMAGSITTSSTQDPTLTLSSSVNNDTGLIWTDYHVNVAMNAPFSFGSPSVNNPPSNDWFISSIVPPTLQGSGPYAGQYEGTLNFLGGTQVGIGGLLDFSYSITFGSSTDYAFTQEMIPSGFPVPEPGTLAMLGIGGLIALGFRRK